MYESDKGDAALVFEGLAQRPGLRVLSFLDCDWFAESYESLLCARFQSLTYLCIGETRFQFEFLIHPRADLFAGLPALEVLDLLNFPLGMEGTRLLASRGWRHLRRLHIAAGDEELAELARGACRWPALEGLLLDFYAETDLGGAQKPTLEEVRRWAPRVILLQLR